MLTKIDWNLGHSKEESNDVPMKLSNLDLNNGAVVSITEMRTTEKGHIVCTVSSEDLEGNTLWLSGKYGLQNGAVNLKNLVGSDDTEDYKDTFIVSKVPSDKSITGYRYEWQYATN
jgi:hypothetical protein